MSYPLILGPLAVVFLTGAWRLGRRQRREPAGPGPRRGTGDALGLGVALAAALFSVRPYLTGRLVGSGDSYHYALQIADFVTQVRRGVLPVLVGQSEYLFNGAVHNVRTAPYLAHLAALLDLLTLRRLSFVQLQDLVVALSALAAAAAAYFVARRLSGGRRLAAALLAAIYVTSPAVLGPLVISDMFATYLAAPWLVLCWYGLAEILRRTDDTRPQWVAALALAMLWYAHSPIAAWMSMAWAGVQVGRYLLSAGAAGQVGRQLAAGLLFAGLSAYLFVSVATLPPGPAAAAPAGAWETAPGQLAPLLRAALAPVAPPGAGPADIQLGWTLWTALLLGVGVLMWRRRIDGWFLGIFSAGLILWMFPLLPWVSSLLRWLTPGRLVALNAWPQQRFMPILGAAAIVAAAAALQPPAGRRGRAQGAAVALLLLGCAWNLREAARLQQRTVVADRGAAAARLAPDNLVLTRASYDQLGALPPDYTDGWADPEFESRVLDGDMDRVQDDAAGVLAATAARGGIPAVPLAGPATLRLTAPGDYLLAFRFDQPAAAGEITIRGAGIDRHYTLPRSGGPLAFGSAAGCATTVPLHLAGRGDQAIVVTSSAPGVSVAATAFAADRLPVRLTAETPFTAGVHAAEAGYLETPRVWQDGYAATVGGRPASVRRSPNGLVAVPVPAGDSTVVLSYVGPPVLRLSWLLSLVVLAALPWLTLAIVRPAPPAGGGGEIDRTWLRQNHLVAALGRLPRRRLFLGAVITGLAGCTIGAGFVVDRRAADRRAFGSLRLTVEFPKWPPDHAEPLVVTGRTGAADCVYVIYDRPHEIRLGLDHWRVGGPVSPPIHITYGRPHMVELTVGSLYPEPDRAGPDLAARFRDPRAAPFRLSLDGHVVFAFTAPFYPAGPREVAIGLNPVGSSVCGASFTGRVLAAGRFLPAPLQLAPAGPPPHEGAP